MSFRTACIQLNCQDDLKQNFQEAQSWVKDAAKEGCDFITLPEHVDVILKNKKDIHKYAQTMDNNWLLNQYKNLAASVNKWLLVGSIAVKIEASDKLVNRSLLINNDGALVAFYDKMHQFDVDLEEDKTIYRESDNYQAGKNLCVTKLDWCNIGMSICYDLRFPNLYQKLALNGANLITIPAAFTKVTGKAHWEVLTRARAIENGCFIVAAAQTGTHCGASETYGHSIIIDPWGKILAQADDKVGFISAEIDISLSDKARKQIPNLIHRKEI